MDKRQEKADGLISEAIERILLDIVVRGHGDRLIGRWSREPAIQRFLERVPYMLDRVNQLHLACTRAEPRHQDHHPHRRHHRQQRPAGQSSLHDFVGLVGQRHHWLVRTRDALGLTPLHKAVLFNNRPIVEYILDRYPDELAPGSGWPSRRGPAPSRLIDAQDKYGRTALHYAAAWLRRPACPTQQRRAAHLYHFLLSKGAAPDIKDFRGKSAEHYARHPQQLRAKSIIHLANKLNADYQANVLTKTLRLAATGHLGAACRAQRFNQWAGDERHQGALEAHHQAPDRHRASMSLSCADLSGERACQRANGSGVPPGRHEQLSHSAADLSCGPEDDADDDQRLVENLCRGLPATPVHDGPGRSRAPSDPKTFSDTTITLASGTSFDSLDSQTAPDSPHNCHTPGQDLQWRARNELNLKKLVAERCPRLVLDDKTRQAIKRAMSEGIIDKINALLLEGYGQVLVDEAPVSCWNARCRRYISKVLPSLLARLDTLHECIATNQLLAVKAMLISEPMLARIRRPYRRASMGALHLAVQFNRRTIVGFLVERFPELVSQRDSHGATCLHWAARSLHSDRIYCWLNEHFGAQLEHLRDSKLKNAADYRQQAVRLASFEQLNCTNPTDQLLLQPHTTGSCTGKPVSVQTMLNRSQERQNQLKLAGVRAKLNSRGPRHSSQAGKPKVAAPDTQQALTAQLGADRAGANEPRLDQVEIGFGAPNLIGCMHGHEHDARGQLVGAGSGVAGAQPDAHGPSQAAWPSRETEKPSSARTHSTPISVSQLSPVRRCSDSRLRSADLSWIRVTDSSGGPRQTTVGAANDETLDAGPSLERVAQVTFGPAGGDQQQRHLHHHQEEQTLEPPEPWARPHSATSSTVATSSSGGRKLDDIIGECIQTNDFKKLEHLVLAGCGRRVVSVYERNYAQMADERRERHQQAQISPEMRQYLERHAPECMKTIELIHELIHKCFSTVRAPKLAPESSDEPAGEAGPEAAAHKTHEWLAETVNSTFHRLCNLFARKSLLVARDTFGASPLHVALVRSDKRLLDYLIRRHPEAASGPDHENRNALHYGAIVLAAYERHGPLKLVRGECASNSAPPAAFWLVDQTARLIYDSLCARYGAELSGARDKWGRTGSDYLARARDGAIEHVALARLPAGPLGPATIAGCCPDYAPLLARYDYLIWNEPAGADEHGPADSASEGGAARANDTVTLAEDPGAGGGWPRRSPKRVKSLDDAPAPKSAHDHQLAGPADSHQQRPPTAKSASEPGDAANLLGELLAPVGPHGADRPSAEQAAPSASHQLGLHPASQLLAGLDEAGQAERHAPLERANDSKTLQQQDQPGPAGTEPRPSGHQRPLLPLYDHLGPLDQLPPANHHHHHHHHHHYRRLAGHLARHRHHHGRASRHSSVVRQSIVGGVIVPTIIHNDNRDEIETYDIIYRQPPTSSRASGASSCSSTSSSSSMSDRDEPAGPSRRRRAGAPNAECAPDSDGRDEAPEEDEDDERVERLSNEFEDRVRREKSELRAKVDQIMREIKLSAKSGKSSRFLASPNDLAALDQHKPLAQSSSATILFNRNEHTKSKSKSVSSSGHSSAQTNSQSSSPTSSSCSHTTTCSLIGSSSLTQGSRSSRSSCSSASSSSSSVLAGTIKPDEQGKQRGESANEETRPVQRQTPGRQNPSLPAHGKTQISELTAQLVSKNTYGQTYLHFIASRSQSPSTFYKVLDHGTHLIGERDIFYRTARDVALQFSLPNNVQVLDKFIIDLFIGAKTSLLWLLLNQGYSPLIHVSDPDGNDIMLILKLLKLDRMIHYLLQMADFQRWRDELHTFIRHGYSAGVSELIKKHKDLVKAKSVYSRTSLHLAVLFDRLDMIHELIEADPTSIHITDNMGRTPLHYVYGLHLKNGEQIRDKLIACGANVDARDVKMRTPKYYYIFRREIEEIQKIELELN